MTVKELKQILDELGPGYDNMIVVVSQDEEGNGFKELCYVQDDLYFNPEERETKNEEDIDEYDTDFAKCITLWP